MYSKFIGTTPPDHQKDYIKTGDLLESQSGLSMDNPAHIQVMLGNSINQGFAEEDIEIGMMDNDECIQAFRDKDFRNDHYSDKRSKKYFEADVSPNALIFALWEKVMESRPDSADALEIKRQQVKTDYPKQ